jgi:hypothetical protein
MASLSGKKIVNFVEYRPYSFIHRPGFVFEEGIANRFRLNSYQLGQLLEKRNEKGERLAYLVVDEHAWEEAVAHARGKKTSEETELLKLKKEKQAKQEELQRLGKELESKKRKLPTGAPRDPKDAAKAANESSKIYKEISDLQIKAAKLQQELQHVEQGLAKYQKK